MGAPLRGTWPSMLQRLTIAHNNVGREDGTVALAAALRCSVALQELDVTHTQADMGMILEALANDALVRNLRRLHLGMNKLTRATAAQLAEFLGRASSLAQLGLARVQLQPGLRALMAVAIGNGASARSPSTRPITSSASAARALAQQLGADGTCGLCGLLRSTSLTEGGVTSLLYPLAVPR